MARHLGLDYGAQRIGVAISDDEGRLAVPSETINASLQDEAFAAIKKIVDEKAIEKIVVGLPLSLDGRPSAQTQKTQDFICALEEYLHMPVDFEDERLTSIHADAGGHNKATRDSRAAALFLQSYLDRHIQR